MLRSAADGRSRLAFGRMAAIVDYLHFKDPIDTAIFARFEIDLVPQMRAVEGFRGLEVIEASEHDAIIVILGDSIEALVQIASELSSPWMQEHIVRLLDRPLQRNIGRTIASA